MRKLWFWVFILVLGNVIWLSLDTNPPAWDQAAHLKGVILVNQWLKGEFNGGFLELIRSFWGYPPLIYFMGGFWSLLVGTGVNQITYLNTLFLILGVFGIYKLSGNKLLPAILFSLFPVIYDTSRNLLLDLPLTVWVIWGLYFWLNKKDFGWLLMLILASLTKLNGFIYFLPMILISLKENYKNKEFLMKLVIAAALYIVSVGWWWGINWQNIWQYLNGLAGQGEKLTDPMNIFSGITWIHYFKLFFLHQLGPITALFFLFFAKKENKKLIWWLVINYIIFTIIKNKDFRFTMPLLAVIAVWFGWGLEKLKQKWVVALILIWMSFNYIENSYNWPIKKPIVFSTPTYLLGNVDWINFSDYPVREYRNVIWPNLEILSDIVEPKSKLLVLINLAELNDNTLNLYRLMTGKNYIQIHGVDQWQKIDFDYILLPNLKTQSAPFYDTQLRLRQEVIKNIWENIDNYEKIAEYTLPNGGAISLLRVN